METTELRMSSQGYELFKKYLEQTSLIDGLSILAVDDTIDHRINITHLSTINTILRQASMTLEFIMANEVSEVETVPVKES